MGTGEEQDRGPRWDGLYNWQLSKLGKSIPVSSMPSNS